MSLTFDIRLRVTSALLADLNDSVKTQSLSSHYPCKPFEHVAKAKNKERTKLNLEITLRKKYRKIHLF